VLDAFVLGLIHLDLFNVSKGSKVVTFRTLAYGQSGDKTVYIPHP
jgi:hypothetical protein